MLKTKKIPTGLTHSNDFEVCGVVFHVTCLHCAEIK